MNEDVTAINSSQFIDRLIKVRLRIVLIISFPLGKLKFMNHLTKFNLSLCCYILFFFIERQKFIVHSIASIYFQLERKVKYFFNEILQMVAINGLKSMEF